MADQKNFDETKYESNQDKLVESWSNVIDSEKHAPIVGLTRRRATAQLLENQAQYIEKELGANDSLNEAVTTTGNMALFDPILMTMVRRAAPKLIAYDIAGVQPMTMPTGLIFAMTARYTDVNGAEALFNEADTAFSGTGTHTGTDPFAAGYSTGTGKTTAAGETDPWNTMTTKITKTSVEAKTRQLKTSYSIELQTDMQNVHGLSAPVELGNILSMEIIAETNRELVRTLFTVAKQGAQWAGIGTPGQFDLNSDADGRWSVEKYKGLFMAIERDANQIAVQTRRGKGNILIVDADTCAALVLAGMLDYAPALQNQTGDLENDITGTTFAGTMLGRYRVYLDPYITSNGYLVGYKGSSQYDAGVFYCPYVPLTMHKAVDPTNFDQQMGFKSRYGLVSNPFTTLNAADNIYYRKTQIMNL